MSIVPQTNRDSKGRFVPGNTTSSAVGTARAAKLSPRRRSSIARKGFKAMVRKHFLGDGQAARRRWAAVGTWNSERVFEGTPIPVRAVWPGTVSEWLERYWQLGLLDGAHTDVNFYGGSIVAAGAGGV